MYWMTAGLATVLGAVMLLYFQNITLPQLGVDDGQFKPLANQPNGVSTQSIDEAKRVAPIPFEGDRDEVMQQLEALISEVPGATIKQLSGHYLYAVFSSATFGFRDDVEIFVDEANSLIHFRSQSRAGYSDLGVNRKRYQSFAKYFNQGLPGKS